MYQMRPQAVRVSSTGFEVRTAFGTVVRTLPDQVHLRNAGTTGFGVFGPPNRPGIILSPAQFAAAKRIFPVDGARSRGTAGTDVPLQR
ncbi:MAG: hypothetical protein ACREDE_05790 [Thermoplasmata archaeon]